MKNFWAGLGIGLVGFFAWLAVGIFFSLTERVDHLTGLSGGEAGVLVAPFCVMIGGPFIFWILPQLLSWIRGRS